MHCRNCAHAHRFVLLFELTVLVTAAGDVAEPAWSLALECPACASTDVSGDPVDLFVAGVGRDR